MSVHAESNINKSNSFNQMIEDQLMKYDTRKHATALPKDKQKVENPEEMDDSNDLPVKDTSYDFFKEGSSLLEKSKRFSDNSDAGASENRTNSASKEPSEKQKFIDLGRFGSADGSSKSIVSNRASINAKEANLSIQISTDFNISQVKDSDCDILPTRESANNTALFSTYDPIPKISLKPALQTTVADKKDLKSQQNGLISPISNAVTKLDKQFVVKSPKRRENLSSSVERLNKFKTESGLKLSG